MENVSRNDTAVVGAGDDLMGAVNVRTIIPQFIEYFPLIAMLQNVASAATIDARAVAITAVLKFLSARTDTPLDDELLLRVEAVLRTPQGVELLQWCGKQFEGLVAHDSIARSAAAQAVG